MKRFISALAFCVSLLVLLSLFLFPPARASAVKENAIMKLLNLPAPPPPNPLVKGSRQRDAKFYERDNPPDDNAPIEDLIDYWTHQSGNYRGILYYSARPSERTVARLNAEMAREPGLATELLNILPDNKDTIDTIKEIFDRTGSDESADKNLRGQLRGWLRTHSPYFSGELARASQGIKDIDNYIGPSDQNNLLALTRHDFDKASPIINQLYNDGTQPASKGLATWALYKRALETGSLSDTDRYRGELMQMVENRSLPDGVRDLANDALTHGPDFAGRDEWTLSLFEDETLVNMPRYSMLTTLVLYSPPNKYVPKMIALAGRTSNPVVRAAAIHNLVMALNANPSPELELQIIECLLPWLEDPKWASDSGWLNDTRGLLVRKLIEHRIPESVPGLIHILDEKEKQTSGDAIKGSANAMRPANANIAPATNASRSSANSIKGGPVGFSYPYRQSAISALGKQKDGRAVPALRRVLSELNIYERHGAIKTILDCGGFSVPEQMDALEALVKNIAVSDGQSASNKPYIIDQDEVDQVIAENLNQNAKPRPMTSAEISIILGQQIMQSSEISDEFARAIVDRIEILDQKDPSLAGSYRRIILKWHNAVINILLLRDLKRDIANADTIVRLLSQRKSLRERQSGDLADLRTGKATAVGIAACLHEDQTDYLTILENGDTETKTAMLACARLIRSPLPVAKVAENLKSQNQILQIAAERYLESEDSPEARGYVLARHPNEAMILGATSAFYVKDVGTESSAYLWSLYQSVGDESLYNGWGPSHNDAELAAAEKQLQAEVKKDPDILGIYAYDRNYIRIYKDRVIFSWDEDDSRYRERPLTSFEFEEIKSYFTTSQVDELPPFLSCGGEYCSAKELVMLGRNGGRRIYTNGGSSTRNVSEFFAWLDKYFADLKLTKATLKYALSREIPGLEILLSAEGLHAETVWAQGNDVRVAASDISARKKLQAEIENLSQSENEIDEQGPNPETLAKREALVEKSQYEGVGWYKVADGETAGGAVQPPQVEYIPSRDALSVQPSDEQWKARAGDVEIRASNEGLYKVVRGRLTRLHKGFYYDVVVAPNGRWAVASKSDESDGGIVRVDLVTNREYPVAMEGYGQKYTAAYIPTLNKFLIVNNQRYHDEGGYGADEADVAPDDVDPAGLFLLDPATGVLRPIAGEFRPLSQQTFRPLQNAARPNEFWAAMYDPEKKETQVGVYDAKLFGFKTILRIPKIKFNSMGMWVDDSAGKVYFVYRGHLLALPIGKQN